MLEYQLLTDLNDPEINQLKYYHQHNDIQKYITISDNYFNYVISNDKVFYYKIKFNNEIIGALHIEKDLQTIYLSIWIKPDHHHLGFATEILQDLIDRKLNIEFNKIIVSIDKENYKSINLFKKVGFKENKTEDELIEFVYNMEK